MDAPTPTAAADRRPRHRPTGRDLHPRHAAPAARGRAHAARRSSKPRAEAEMSPEAFAYVAGSAGREATTRTPTAPPSTAAASSPACCATSASAAPPPPCSAAAGRTRCSSPRSACRKSPIRKATSPPPAPAPRNPCRMVMSNQASHPMEAIAAEMGERRPLVPALLGQVRRAGREPRTPRRSVRMHRSW